MKINWEKVQNLVPAIIQHHTNKEVLMLGFMTPEALELTKNTGLVHFFSRTKNRIWKKGEDSGNTISVISIETDCDNDTLLIQANPKSVVCHKGDDTCFGNFSKQQKSMVFLDELEKIIKTRITNGKNESYVASLFASGINRIAQKVGEEAVEVVIATLGEEDKLKDEASDLLFHLMILLKAKELSLSDIILNLKTRHYGE